MNKIKILIIDDEPQIRRLLNICFESAGYNVINAENSKSGYISFMNSQPDIVILDLGLPDGSGFDFLKSIREFSAIPVIIISVKNETETIINALDIGADDYITKPFNTDELLARVRVALRHINTIDNQIILKNDCISMDITKRIVTKYEKEVKLTSTEYSLLLLFMKNPDKVLTHQFILKEIWGKFFSDETQYLRIYIAQLRKIFEKDSRHPTMFLTEQGIGYRMKTK